MERESFTSLPVAKLLNDGYVSIKVDKEERSDVDRVYMTYVQVRCSGLTCACPRLFPRRNISTDLSSVLAKPASARKRLWNEAMLQTPSSLRAFRSLIA